MSKSKIEEVFSKRPPPRFQHFPILSRFGANGALKEHFLLGPRPEYARFICGAMVGNDMVLVGMRHTFYDEQPPDGRRRSVAHPWIVKVDGKGQIMWERVLPDDQDGVLSADPWLSTCMASADRDGHVTVAVGVYWRPAYSEKGVRIVVDGAEGKSVSSYLIVRVDSKGNEKARQRLAGVRAAQIFLDAGKYLVVSHTGAMSGEGIRKTWLDTELKIAGSIEVDLRRHNISLGSVLPGRSGGLHLSGTWQFRPGETAPAVGFLDGDGKLLALRTITRDSRFLSPQAVAEGRTSDEIAVAMVFDELVKFMRLKYRD